MTFFPKNFLQAATNEERFGRVVKMLASLLIFIVLIGFIVGTVKTFIDLQVLFKSSVEEGLKVMLLNVLNLLAVIEVLKTGLSYIKDGRVRVTYIVDTVLIVMLTEVLSFWYKGDYSHYVALIAILLTLIAIRVLAIRFSPRDIEE